MERNVLRWLASAALAFVPVAFAQDAGTAAWLEKEGLDAASTKSLSEFDAVIARPKGGGDERAIIFAKGKPMWQSNPKETEPGSKWTINSIGRDLDGNGQPDVHFSANTGGANCCVTHHIYELKPKVRRIAVYSAGSMGASDFIDVPGRKAPIMISADDSSANAFAPYANSYFPLLILEVGPKGRMEFAKDLMQTRLPGMPPPVCALPLVNGNPWLKERCAEYMSARRQARTKEIKERLATSKATRSADQVRWEDYFENGVLAAVSAEMNRYSYTGHGAAGLNWLEGVWPGNDAVKTKFLTTLRMTQAKSVFAEDLKAIASGV